ncbi:hypothetical protein APY94_03735 [Thermococcus celericrescens]|uniref:Uncharacterized protein n=1 Tax=Thermococcus celericrescens TaxID=227598 RepID=A0A100XYP4_9EURY|nr:hypothetical protein [Thermococcus celericrescens]KUH33995.1 hypothetical protein APY94_03735 [Thermococcus celericrescens]
MYYAAYLFKKPIKDLTPEDIYRAERVLIPLVLKYYLNPTLNWKKKVDCLLQELQEFYIYHCKRKKRWSFKNPKQPLDEEATMSNLTRFLKGEYDIHDVLQWCSSPVPRSRYAFIRLLKKTNEDDIKELLKSGEITEEQLVEVCGRRGSKFIPAVRAAIYRVLGSQEGERKIRKKRKRYKPKQGGLGNSVADAYFEISGIQPSNYIKKQNIIHEFKLQLIKIWFTSENREEREWKLNMAFPGLLKLVSYTTVWYFIREQVDEYLLYKALSPEELERYLKNNRFRLGGKLYEKLLKALYMYGQG